MFQELSLFYYLAENWYRSHSGRPILFTTKIKNQKLARELEEACIKNDGILTYSEYLQIEQFGTYGYHSTHAYHGTTEVHARWGKALAALCLKNNYHHIIEFGCGNGGLGLTTIKEYQKLSEDKLSWTGVEINPLMHQVIRDRFKAEKLTKYLAGTINNLNALKEKNKSLIVFPYALDSIPPEIFTNTTQNITCPNAMLGISVINGILKEAIIPQNIMVKKNISITDGIYNSGKYKFDLKTWKLHKGQRAYINVNAFALIYEYVLVFPPESLFVFIDEFRRTPFALFAGYLGIPKELKSRSVDCADTKSYYKNAGRQIFYFPAYQETFYKFLHALDFQSVRMEIEQKLSAEITGKKWIGLRSDYLTNAFLAVNKISKNLKILPVTFYSKKIL